jgi:hypothetical protein
VIANICLKHHKINIYIKYMHYHQHPPTCFGAYCAIFKDNFLDPLYQAILRHSRFALSKRPNRLSASCLKMEAEPASET